MGHAVSNRGPSIANIVCTAVCALSVGSTGCFYVDAINQRPSLDIRADSTDPIHRGDTVTLRAIAYDPDDHGVDFEWRVYACTDASVFADCDAEPVVTGIAEDLTFEVPRLRADPDGDGPAVAVPVQSMRAVLEGTDDHGASAKPTDQLLLSIVDHEPEVAEIRVVSNYGFVIGTPVDLFSSYRDGDDELAALVPEWKAYSPANVEFTLTDRAVPQDDPLVLQTGRRLLPTAIGPWDVRLTVRDPLAHATEKATIVTIVEDRPPCVVTLPPLPPPTGQVLVVDEPTLFQIQVDDDLDRWPPTGDPIRQLPTFAWSMRAGSGTRQLIAGASGNSVAFDPDAFVPGTVVELRVEIADRKQTPLACADGDPTCSVISTSCLQRQTWRLEAR
ncbi:MAG: hypothetical protein H0T89_18365 [Deltaproteobacteria bacterium]|nr:hypothetical protein [Deltaproteobacteria bacterium]